MFRGVVVMWLSPYLGQIQVFHDVSVTELWKYQEKTHMDNRRTCTVVPIKPRSSCSKSSVLTTPSGSLSPVTLTRQHVQIQEIELGHGFTTMSSFFKIFRRCNGTWGKEFSYCTAKMPVIYHLLMIVVKVKVVAVCLFVVFWAWI